MNGLEDISGRAYVRTDGRDSLGLKRLRRETKKTFGRKFSDFLSIPILSIYGEKRPICASNLEKNVTEGVGYS